MRSTASEKKASSLMNSGNPLQPLISQQLMLHPTLFAWTKAKNSPELLSFLSFFNSKDLLEQIIEIQTNCIKYNLVKKQKVLFEKLGFCTQHAQNKIFQLHICWQNRSFLLLCSFTFKYFFLQVLISLYSLNILLKSVSNSLAPLQTPISSLSLCRSEI